MIFHLMYELDPMSPDFFVQRPSNIVSIFLDSQTESRFLIVSCYIINVCQDVSRDLTITTKRKKETRRMEEEGEQEEEERVEEQQLLLQLQQQ